MHKLEKKWVVCFYMALIRICNAGISYTDEPRENTSICGVIIAHASIPTALQETKKSVVIDSIDNPKDKNLRVYFFRPSDAKKPLPVVFFCHGIGATDPARYRYLIDYVIQHNVCVCYPTYTAMQASILPAIAYSHLWKGIESAQDHWRHYIDIKRIGFIGHSYGGGATAKIAWKAVHQKGWGKEACFIYIMAPWYCYGMPSSRFGDFPAHTILVMQVFENDHVNDYRIALDIYNSFKTPEERKCFITVFSAKNGSTVIPASHSIPEIEKNTRTIGRYVIFPVVDSLLQYAFNQSALQQASHFPRVGEMRTTGGSDGWECAFFKGSSCKLEKPQRKYINFWNHAMNPRSKVTSLLPHFLRLGMQTPQTVLRYCAFGLDKIHAD